jgi:hypothetical protein
LIAASPSSSPRSNSDKRAQTSHAFADSHALGRAPTPRRRKGATREGPIAAFDARERSEINARVALTPQAPTISAAVLAELAAALR